MTEFILTKLSLVHHNIKLGEIGDKKIVLHQPSKLEESASLRKRGKKRNTESHFSIINRTLALA